MEGDDHGEAYTAILWGVGLSHEMAMSQGPRRSREPKATCAGPLCEDLSPCRGLRPHHARRERQRDRHPTPSAGAPAMSAPGHEDPLLGRRLRVSYGST